MLGSCGKAGVSWQGLIEGCQLRSCQQQDDMGNNHYLPRKRLHADSLLLQVIQCLLQLQLFVLCAGPNPVKVLGLSCKVEV